MSSRRRVTVKLLVHKEKKKVVLAECDNDFVDILLSFLTLPLGTIIRILGKPRSSSLGSLANLYDGVASLDASYFETAACKEMLLRPRSAAGEQCEKLAINIDDANPRTFYTCQRNCLDLHSRCFYYCSAPHIRCKCGKQMDRVGEWARWAESGDGVFVKKGYRFMISDDLNVQVLPSTAVLVSEFDKLGVKDVSVLEERILGFGPQEVADLLTRLLVSDNPLTDLCFGDSGSISQTHGKDILAPKTDTEAETITAVHGEIKMKLIIQKDKNKIVYAEQGEEMLDLLLSFLTFPLGMVIKLLNKDSGKRCIDNLYKSVENLDSSYIPLGNCKQTLLSPILAPFFGCSSQPLKIGERLRMRSLDEFLAGVEHKSLYGYGYPQPVIKEVNPKSVEFMTEPGGGYAKRPGTLIVTDDLHVLPLSAITTVQMLNEGNIPISGLTEKEVRFGEAKALDLLKAALVSQTVLSDVFSSGKKRPKLPALV